MAVTYSWTVTGLRTRTEGNNVDSVIQTHWKCVGTDEHGHSATFIGATPFTSENVSAEDFVPFEQLTEEIVLGWIQDHVNSNSAYKAHIEERIQKQLNYFHVNEPELPWSGTPSVAPQPTNTQDPGVSSPP